MRFVNGPRGIMFKFTRRWLWLDETGAPVVKSVPIPLVFTVWRGDSQTASVVMAKTREQAASYGPGQYTVTPCDPDTGEALPAVNSWTFDVDEEGAAEAGWGGRLREID